MNAKQRAVDAALDMIRRMRYGASSQVPASFGYRLGDDLGDAARRAPGTAISTDVVDPSVAPKAVAGAAGAGLSAGMIGLGMFGEEPAVTSGGEADLAADVPPLVVPVDDAVAPTPARKSPLARAVDEAQAFEIAPGTAPDTAGPTSLQPADGLRAAVGRGSLYPEEAALVAREREMEDTAEALGMPRQNTLPQHMRDAAAGNDMVGRFRFVHSPTGLRAVDTTPSEAEQRAAFTRWANAEPGSDRQRQYSPAGAAEWDAKVAGNISRWAQEDLAVSADPELAAARRAAEKKAFDDRIARRDFLENDPRTQAIRGKREARDAMLENNRRLLQQHPFLTLGDKGLNEWQQFVLSQNMLRGDQKVTDPNAVKAQQLNNIGDVIKRSLTAAAAGMQPQAVSDAQAAAAAAGATMKENELPVEDHVEIERKRGNGVIRGNTSAGRRLLQTISDAYVGNMYATTKEVDDAVAEAVRQGVPREDAEAFFAPRRRTMYQWATGS